jgi:hypothetical protein
VSIRFETTIDHLVAFNRFHYLNSPMWRRQRLVQSLVVPALAAGIVFILWTVVHEEPFRPAAARNIASNARLLMVGLAVAAIVSFFVVRWRATANLESSVRKLLAEGSNRAVLGWCDMALAGNRLTVKREWIESSFDLRAVQKIAQTDEFTFVYVSSVNAIVIPMRLFPEDEYRDFVAELLEAWENRDAPPPAGQPDDRFRLSKTS